MISLARKTVDNIIACILGGIIATAITITLIAVLFGVPQAVTLIVGTLALLFWLVAGLLWLLT
jgi:hypothetical protein